MWLQSANCVTAGEVVCAGRVLQKGQGIKEIPLIFNTQRRRSTSQFLLCYQFYGLKRWDVISHSKSKRHYWLLSWKKKKRRNSNKWKGAYVGATLEEWGKLISMYLKLPVASINLTYCWAKKRGRGCKRSLRDMPFTDVFGHQLP